MAKRKWKKPGSHHLTAHERQAMPRGEFALPGKGEGPNGAGAGSYPIPDENHARNALARVSQHGSSEEKSKVRAAVHRKFPEIGEGKAEGGHVTRVHKADRLYGRKRVGRAA